MFTCSPQGIANLAAALAKAQAEMPIVSLDKAVNYKAVNFEYASLSNIIATTKPVLARHQLAILQFAGTSDGMVNVETMLLHSSGEYISSTISARLSKIDDPKDLGSLITYLRRYSYSIVNVALDGDFDATVISEKYIETPEQKVWLRDTLTPMGVTDQGVLRQVSAEMKRGNYEMTEDALVKALEAIRK